MTRIAIVETSRSDNRLQMTVATAHLPCFAWVKFVTGGGPKGYAEMNTDRSELGETRMAPLVTRSLSVLLAGLLSLTLASPAAAYDKAKILKKTSMVGTVDIKYTDGRIEQSQPLWRSKVPTTVRLKYDSFWEEYQGEIPFVVQPLMAYDEAKDLDVDFEIWSKQGEEIDSIGFSGCCDWNPTGGPKKENLNVDDLKPGKYILIVTTKWELSTNGLLTRYLEGRQQFDFVVKK